MKVYVGCPQRQTAPALRECLKCDTCTLQSDSCNRDHHHDYYHHHKYHHCIINVTCVCVLSCLTPATEMRKYLDSTSKLLDNINKTQYSQDTQDQESPGDSLREVEGVLQTDLGASEGPGDLGDRGAAPVTEHGGELGPLLQPHHRGGHLGPLRRI